MQLGQITPEKATRKAAPRKVSSPEKAAIIVRFLMTEGANVPIKELPEDLQAELTHQMGTLRRIDRDTLVQVVEEFANELEQTGLTFPKGVAGALSELDGQITPRAAAQIRRRTGVRDSGDPWERLRGFEPEKLLQLIEEESIEVAAVLISKIDVKKAAEMLGNMPGERARRITYSVSLTSSITPDAVDRIGRALIVQLENEPERAFESEPVDRVGAILNSSRSATRDALLEGLNNEDEEFASEVRKAIFTFKHIATRVDARDIAAILRVVDNDTLVTALAGALDELTKPSADFILNNISNRLADQMREAIDERGEVGDEEAETAMSDVVAGVRQLADNGEILLIQDVEA